RVLARELPGAVETFEITIAEAGLPTVEATVRRATLEDAATDPRSEDVLWEEIALDTGAPRRAGAPTLPGAFPRFSYGIAPSLAINAFDPDDPLRPDLGIALSARYELARGLSFNGTLRQTLTNGFDDVTRPPQSDLPNVRTLISSYLREGTTAIRELTVDYRGKPMRDLYGRVTAGILEQQYAGVSAELLYRPLDWNVGLGVELNYARQREFEQLFGLRDFDTVTGHASLYWDTGWNDFEVQVDAGRYLAGDYGATFSLSRRFDNGWELGGFFTLTDVPFDEFGEGSFDKGLRLTVPLGWSSARETRTEVSTTLRPLTRDGGARLNVPGRLWGEVRDASVLRLDQGWGEVWQ
ncbi:YjbH domain-containing protein, partial [Roseobacter sp. HKCCA0434]|uniref:YjbH domain-containing protein n=1 Tax=Roseobacter sp. HKCCA0434 TaxID=3079297 RepID=UPI0029058A7F